MMHRPAVYSAQTLAVYIQHERSELRFPHSPSLAADRYAELGKWVTLLYTLHPLHAQGIIAHAR